MKIWDLCIRRPVFTLMLVVAPVVLGLASYARLGVELFPNADVPVVTITTTLRGASAEEMETSVTREIEEAVNTVSGIDELRSTTREGMSSVVVMFKLSKDGNVAAQEVDAKVRTVLGRLPIGTDPPVIDKIAVDATPILTIAISGRRDLREVTEIARKRIKEDLETISGVGSVVIVGGRTRAVNVVLDVDKLQKYEGLTVEDVRQAIARENQEQPGGRVDRGQIERVMRTLGRVERPSDLEGLIVSNRDGQPIRIEDLGTVRDSSEEPRGLSRLWARGESPGGADDPGANSVSLVIQKQSGANTVEVAHAVKTRLAKIQESLPSDIQNVIIRDQSRFIENSMHEVKVHLVLAALLVVVSILLFLRDWRTTMIAALAIPTSMIGTFAFMDFMGFSLNNLTMLGLILAIGIVVDDAVVVIENIFRHMEEKGESPLAAASKGTSEIALAVAATTLSLVVIFAPIAFMGGMVGRFLSCFGWVVGFSVLMSMAVSFTMTPALCAWILKPVAHGGSKNGLLWRFTEWSYATLLGWALRNRWAVVVLSFAVLASTPMLMKLVGQDFVAKDDQSEFEVAITLPAGYTLDRVDSVLTDVDRTLRKLPGVTHTFVTIGDTTGRVAKGQGDVTKASIYVRIVDIAKRDYSQFDVMTQARDALTVFPELRTSVQEVAALSAGTREVDFEIVILGPEQAKIEEYARDLARWLKESPGYTDVDTSIAQNNPELRVRPDRERLSDLGVSIQSVAATTNVLVGGEPVSKYKEGAEQYDIWLRAERSGRADADAIGRIGVPATRAPGGAVHLGTVAHFEEAVGPATIDRFNRQRQVNVWTNLDGKDMGVAQKEVAERLASMNLPPEYRYEYLGQAKTMSESNENFAVGFLMAFIFMYMILAAQFESLVHPISIMASLPLTIPCAILALVLMQSSLDLFGMLGLFMLFGIVKKNGILQVEYTNQLRAQGMERDEAILAANRARLRPILMTTVMLVAAMIPMALGQGPGASSRASMAKVILGGQALSLVLTLLVTPVAYSLFDSAGSRVRRLLQR